MWEAVFYTEVIYWCAAIVCLLSIFYIDATKNIIPDRFVYPLFLVTVLRNHIQDFLAERLLFALIIFVVVYVSIIVTKNKAFGGGDLKLITLIAFMLGFPKGLYALYIGFFLATLYFFFVAFVVKEKVKEIPLGPFLVIGFVASFALYYFNYLMAGVI